MAVMTGVLVFVAQMVLQSRRFFYYGGSHQRRGRGGHPILFVVMIVVFLVTAILVPILARLIQMAISRQREYLADATAVKLTRDPGGLIAALQKIASSNEPAPRTNSALEPLFIVTPAQMLQNGHKAWFSTHPPMEKRLERLKALE
jgi:heat shock protein HtpX